MSARGLAPEAQREIDKCIHCGYCLPACPTYNLTRLERLSPRGRIQLLAEVQAGTLPLTLVAEQSLDTCLGCRACEAACPVGVAYGTILAAARSHQRETSLTLKDRVVRLGLRWVVPRLFLLRLALRLARALAPIAPSRLRPFLRGVPAVRRPARRSRPVTASAGGPIAYVFRGCVQEAGYPGVNRATEELLARAGYRVLVPRGQTCCGALHEHWGDREYARRLARQNLEAFPDDDGIVVVNAGGCGAALRELASLFDDPSWQTKARRLARRVRDLSEALIDSPRPLSWARAGRPRVTYQPSCHLAFVQKVQGLPESLIAATGAELRQPSAPLSCCGSAGIFNFLEPDMAAAALQRKVEDLNEVQPEVVVTSNPGCALQLMAAARAGGGAVSVQQLPEFLLACLTPQDSAAEKS